MADAIQPLTAEPLATERRARPAEEAQLLAEAEAEAERDGVIPAAEVNRWVESLGTDTPLPSPKPRRP
jgi:hypothetical protein